MTVQDEFAYGCLCLFGIPRQFIHASSVRDRATDSRAYMGQAWAHEGETVQKGWKRAYKAGWRCVRVRVSLAFGGHA